MGNLTKIIGAGVLLGALGGCFEYGHDTAIETAIERMTPDVSNYILGIFNDRDSSMKDVPGYGRFNLPEEY